MNKPSAKLNRCHSLNTPACVSVQENTELLSNEVTNNLLNFVRILMCPYNDFLMLIQIIRDIVQNFRLWNDDLCDLLRILALIAYFYFSCHLLNYLTSLLTVLITKNSIFILVNISGITVIKLATRDKISPALYPILYSISNFLLSLLIDIFFP